MKNHMPYMAAPFQVLIFASLFLPAALLAQGGHAQVAEGNKLYGEEKYDAANNKYRDALLETPDSPIVHFNIGDVLYKKRNFEDAIKSYRKALAAEDIHLQAKAHYNIGNALYRLGKLPESIMAYKEALKLNPDDEDAKYNLEYVRAKLKDDAQKQSSQNQQQQQQNQEQQNGQQQEQDRREQEKDKQKAQQQQQQREQEQSKQQQQQQAESADKKDISKEDAQRILDALRNEEEDLLKGQKVKAKGRPFRDKDW